MNAKRISNLVKNNVHETNNFSELKRLLRQYEEKIGHLEAEKIREKNQSEELLEMVRRLMAQKKELVDKLSLLEKEELEKLNCNGKSVIAETLDLHNQLDDILKRSNSIVAHSTSLPHDQNLHKDNICKGVSDYADVFRFQNIKLINRILKMKDFLKHRDTKDSKTLSLLEALLKDPSMLFSLEDKILSKLKKKLVASVSCIDEQLISRKLTKRLLNSLQETEVEVKKKDSEYELLKEFSLNSEPENCNCLGKRSESNKGMMNKESIETILRKSGLPCGQIYSDSPLPSPIKATLALIDCDDDCEEINLLEKSVKFNPEIVEKKSLDVEIIKVLERPKMTHQTGNKSAKKLKICKMIVVPESKNSNDNLQIDLTCGGPEDKCNEIVELNTIEDERESAQICDGQLFGSSDRSKLSQETGQGFFKTQREPLAEKSNEPDLAAFPEIASPKSSMYYFTSKKNEYDFSFDRSAVKVEKNLGKALLMDTIQKSMQKENHFRMQR
jgi:hypothetical protein